MNHSCILILRRSGTHTHRWPGATYKSAGYPLSAEQLCPKVYFNVRKSMMATHCQMYAQDCFHACAEKSRCAGSAARIIFSAPDVFPVAGGATERYTMKNDVHGISMNA